MLCEDPERDLQTRGSWEEIIPNCSFFFLRVFQSTPWEGQPSDAHRRGSHLQDLRRPLKFSPADHRNMRSPFHSLKEFYRHYEIRFYTSGYPVLTRHKQDCSVEFFS